jgi:hypothetical protein
VVIGIRLVVSQEGDRDWAQRDLERFDADEAVGQRRSYGGRLRLAIGPRSQTNGAVAVKMW